MEKIKRPDILTGKTNRLKTSCGWIYITNNTQEVFINLGKAGGCAATQTEAIGRIISLALRYNIPMEEITKQLKGIQCNVPFGDVKSCADAIAKALEDKTSDN